MEDYNHVFKVVLVGNTTVGKTSLVQKFTQNIFSIDQQATIGVDFWLKTLKVDNDLIKLHIWDTAGQERFRSITRSYYRNAHAIVFVYDLTSPRSFQCIPEWIADVESLSNEESLKVLVANKLDKFCDRQVPMRIGRGFSAVNGFECFVETSALDSTNVNFLFEYVARRLRDHMKMIMRRFALLYSIR
uniref:Ras-related protein Rab-30 n=1 Tax=Angiostrongylus cantonensis TaxID=6313 RepID=A0A0K0D3Y4_ANGCA